MKNIHLIPTDKPSRLFLNKVNNKLLLDGDTYSNLEKILPSSNYQHLYVTSEEEIKEGDWFLEKAGRQYPIQWNGKEKLNFHCKKIILTTDRSLDGVQPIDDGFLEWFVKNPDCEYVETKIVEFEVDLGLGDSCIERGSYYKINTPKEEPKINLEEMPKEEWDEARNPAYKHFDIDAEYPELDGTNELCNDKIWDDIYHDYTAEQYPAFGGPFTDSISFIDWLKQNYKSPEKK
jgi:hypothetical protein